MSYRRHRGIPSLRLLQCLDQSRKRGRVGHIGMSAIWWRLEISFINWVPSDSKNGQCSHGNHPSLGMNHLWTSPCMSYYCSLCTSISQKSGQSLLARRLSERNCLTFRCKLNLHLSYKIQGAEHTHTQTDSSITTEHLYALAPEPTSLWRPVTLVVFNLQYCSKVINLSDSTMYHCKSTRTSVWCPLTSRVHCSDIRWCGMEAGSKMFYPMQAMQCSDSLCNVMSSQS